MAAFEGLDDDHGGAAAGTGSVVGGCLLLRAVTADEDRHGNERGYRSREQMPSPCQVVDPCGIGQQGAMADAVESRQRRRTPGRPTRSFWISLRK